MKESVLVLEKFNSFQLGNIRLITGWRAACDNDLIWLRGPVQNGNLQVLLNALPATASYTMDQEGRLFPTGKQTPVARIPQIAWQSIADFVTIELPIAALPGNRPASFMPELVRSSASRPAYGVLTDLNEWKTYVSNAPLIKLQQLRFAVSLSGQVLITGQPLPAVQGSFFWHSHRLLIPLGYDFNVPIVAGILSRKLKVEDNELILINRNLQWERIPSSAFTEAKRSVVRALSIQSV